MHPLVEEVIWCVSVFVVQIVVDAVLAIQREGEPIDLHMVEIMQMAHKTDTDTRWGPLLEVTYDLLVMCAVDW